MAYQNPDAVAAGAPPWHLPAPQPRPTAGGIHGFAWALWPWMSWVLPVFFVFHGFLGSGGWGTLMLMFLSPVFVPAAGLLGMLPRFILRRRGHTTAPAPIVWLLFVNWWAWFTLALTMQDMGDSGPSRSLLRDVMTVPLSLDYEQGVFLAALAIAVLAWVAVLVLAIVQPRPMPGVQTGMPRRQDGWTVVAWIAAFVVPALLVATIGAGVVATALQRDAAGDTVAEVSAMPIAAQAERALATYERTQQKLSEVRELIADDGWQIIDDDGRAVGSAGFGSYSWECRRADADCVTIEAGFGIDDVRVDVDGEDFRARLQALGWDADDMRAMTDADGFVLRIDAFRGVNESTWVSIESPPLWGDLYDLTQELGESDDDRVEGTFRFDEWPPLR
ncbi:hypothetical protein ACFY9N_16540 [Microbacterium sp. NPDC008134]|uniref:hypothetical protein n=1 Tax=Microbacterium sp. NPDC008134 TaxID=3364183 RepID=UPI0036E0141C